MGEALGKLAEEDPTFRMRFDEETGQTLISGMGELHLEVIVDRMLREFGVDANVGRPAGGLPRGADHEPSRSRAASCARPVAAASTVSSSSRSSRCERGAGFLFENKTVGGSVPKEYVGPTEAGRQGRAGERPRWRLPGRRRAASRWSTAPTTRSTRPKWRSRWPASRACARRWTTADPVLLEPIMKVEVRTPEEFFGDVLGDINARRGQVLDVETFGTLQIIRGTDPAGGDIRLHDGPALDDARAAPATRWSSTTTSAVPAHRLRRSLARARRCVASSAAQACGTRE